MYAENFKYLKYILTKMNPNDLQVTSLKNQDSTITVDDINALSNEINRLRELDLRPNQINNIGRFVKSLPANAKDSVDLMSLPNGGVAAQAVSLGKVPGSCAVYEKQIDNMGRTVQYSKTTYDPVGNIVHVKDKISGGVSR
jgi:hypothetical protein